MTKFAGALAGLVGVFWLAIAGGWAVWAYDRAPAGWPDLAVGPPVFRWTIRLPDSLGARLAAKDAALAAAVGDEAGLAAALRAQSRAIDRRAKADVARLSTGRRIVAVYRRPGRADDFSRAMARPPPDEDVCDRAKALDARFVAQLKQGGL